MSLPQSKYSEILRMVYKDTQMTTEEIQKMIASKLALMPDTQTRLTYWEGYKDALLTLRKQIEVEK